MGTLDAILYRSGQNQLVVNDISIDPCVTVATINISQQPGTQTATLNIQGSPAYCTRHMCIINLGISLSTLLLWHYLLHHTHITYLHTIVSWFILLIILFIKIVVRKTYVTKTSNYAPKRKNADTNNTYW